MQKPTTPAPARTVVTWHLASGVASLLYQLAEYRDMLVSQAAADVLTQALDDFDETALPQRLEGDGRPPALAIPAQLPALPAGGTR